MPSWKNPTKTGQNTEVDMLNKLWILIIFISLAGCIADTHGTGIGMDPRPPNVLYEGTGVPDPNSEL